jgi:recombination protein RecA
MADSSQEKALKNTLDQINKEFRESPIMRLGANSVQDIQGISTGALSLDIALGGRGLPRGRIVEVFGPEASGKTTVALHALAQAQKQGGVAAFIDVEHALDPGWAKRIGVDLESLLVSQPSCAEDALKIAEMLVSSNAVDIIVIDSVAALVPKAELDGEIGDAHVGVQARLMSQAMRILTPKISRTKTIVVFINQIRQKIGVMFGSPETTSGGLALKFYSSVRLDVRKIGSIKNGDEVIGTEVRIKVVKNKVAPPFRVAEVELMHERGISREGDVLTLAVENEIVVKKGGWHSYGDLSLGNSREKAKDHLRENPALLDEISRKILEKRGLLGGGGNVTAGASNGQLTEQTPVKVEKAEKAEKPEKEKAEKEKAEKPEKSDKTEKAEKAEQTGKSRR